MFGRDYCWRFEHSARIAYCKQGRKLFASEHVRFGGHHPSMAPSVIVAWSTLLRSTNNLLVNAMHSGGKVLVSELGATVADDDIAIGSVADRCLLSGVIQTSHFKGVRTGLDPERTWRLPASQFESASPILRVPKIYKFLE